MITPGDGHSMQQNECLLQAERGTYAPDSQRRIIEPSLGYRISVIDSNNTCYSDHES